MRIFREPLFHFLLLGAVIFGVHSFVTRHHTDKPGEIVVTEGTIESLATGFTRTWQRPPTEGELEGLVRDYIREEAAYREALALGLDRDDMIVRRRLQQKLEFLADDLSTRTEPSDAELQKFLQAHSTTFQTEPLFSFRQIYFNPQLHGENTRRDAIQVLAHLQHSGSAVDNDDLGDPFLLQQSFNNIPLSDLKKTFGEPFAAAISGLQTGVWQGPIDSGYGSHLVYVSQRNDRHLPAFAEIRGQVRREWLDARRRQATDKFYQALLAHYRVKIEPSEEKTLAQVR